MILKSFGSLSVTSAGGVSSAAASASAPNESRLPLGVVDHEALLGAAASPRRPSRSAPRPRPASPRGGAGLAHAVPFGRGAASCRPSSGCRRPCGCRRDPPGADSTRTFDQSASSSSATSIGERRVDALPHLGLAHDHGHDVVGADAHEGVRTKTASRRGRGEAPPRPGQVGTRSAARRQPRRRPSGSRDARGRSSRLPRSAARFAARWIASRIRW